MTKDELQKYLKKNLEIRINEYYSEWKNDTIELLLEGEVISKEPIPKVYKFNAG